MEVQGMDKTERQLLVAECRASGMTAKAWCEIKGIPYRQYIGWATKQNREEKQNQPQQWVEITLAPKEPSADEIKLNCGKWTICVGVGFNPTLLADVLKVVAAVC
jgi:hypothetical protein